MYFYPTPNLPIYRPTYKYMKEDVLGSS